MDGWLPLVSSRTVPDSGADEVGERNPLVERAAIVPDIIGLFQVEVDAIDRSIPGEDGAATIFKQMDDTSIVKIMVFMKDQETGPILAAMSKGGETEAKRAADLTEKLRVAVVPKKK